MQFAVYLNSSRTAAEFVRVVAERGDEFPKALNIKPGWIYTWNLKANGANGGKNEAALKRLSRLIKDYPECYGEKIKSNNMMGFEEAKRLLDEQV